MPQMTETINCIERLIELSPRPLAVFIGSGLSVPEPTALPLASEAITSLLSLDWVEAEEKFPYSVSQIDKNSDLYKIRFEHLLSIFVEWQRHDLGSLLRQFADAPPNGYHRRIAELCSENKIKFVVTTNFDSCLEKALQQFCVTHKVIINQNDAPTTDNLNVFKIHGTIQFSNSKYSAHGLGATLESVYSGLEEWKEKILSFIIERYTIVFLQ